MPLLTPHPLLQGTWRIDRSCSSVGFHIRHLGVATVRGSFTSFSGRADVDAAGLNVLGHVDVASVDTGDSIRDRRLRTEFFDAERHPAITLSATIPGPALLTIRGVTRPVSLSVETEQIDDETIRLVARGRLRRSDFGLDWDALRQAGRLLVADQVRLSADVVMRAAPPG
jgi:polyisoprenoid-binding protein YceI